MLTRCQPYPGDGAPVHPHYDPTRDERFLVEHWDFDTVALYNQVQGFDMYIHLELLQIPQFSIGKWYAKRCAYNSNLQHPWQEAHEWMEHQSWKETTMGYLKEDIPLGSKPLRIWRELLTNKLDLNGIQIDRSRYPSLQRNAAQVKGNQHVLPKPLVVKVIVNGQPARALLDSGLLGDFMSSTLADQLAVK